MSAVLPFFEYIYRLFRLQIAVGTKTGEILLYDLASSSLTDTIRAHAATVWSLHVRADELVSGSADKEVKFWEIVLGNADESVCESQFIWSPLSSRSTL
jgi:U3 small nucleolar RNA-associated protein 12